MQLYWLMLHSWQMSTQVIVDETTTEWVGLSPGYCAGSQWPIRVHGAQDAVQQRWRIKPSAHNAESATCVPCEVFSLPSRSEEAERTMEGAGPDHPRAPRSKLARGA
jgi:hypothetical protein